ncbi:hypothetical protein L4D19_28620 [Photobacterium kasasachensis]
MIDIMEAINLYLVSKSQYYTLWTFYFTASAGILGFVYGNRFARKSKLAKVIASILYMIVISGNSDAIFSTQKVLSETITQIEAVVSDNSISENKGQIEKVNIKPAISVFEVTPINNVKWSYWFGTFLVFVGIWFLNIVRLISDFNSRWSKKNA